jgi:leader peptidase (prepilin peptidase) / N-methyltransferase
VLAAALLAGMFGTAIGSFLNVVIHRLPAGASLGGRSECPGCGDAVRAYDNVPVVSWLLLRGRCRSCGDAISSRYPLVELMTGGLFAAVVLVRGLGPDGLLGVALVAVLVPVAFIDLEHRIIPNAVLSAGAVAGTVLLVALEPGMLPEHLAAGGGAFAFFLLAALAYPAGMGMGDVKLAGVMGLCLGLSVVPALGVAFAVGTAVGLLILAREGVAARKKGVPFGPFLALGAVVGVLAGPELIELYGRYLSG